MQLTNQNIQNLYKFTRKHFVEHYDVQTELVDHLANDIEQIWKEQPKLSFEEARDISFKKFGVFGFMDIYEEKRKQVSKKYWKIIWKFVKSWFQPPKIILTMIIYMSFYLLLTMPFSAYFTTVFLVIYFVAASIKVYQFNKLFKEKTKRTGKNWMLEDFIFKQGAVTASLAPIYLFQMYINTEVFSSISGYVAISFAAFFTAILILGYISLHVIPQKSQELLEKTYPEYKIV